MKTCPRCLQVQPREAFSLNRARVDGLSVYCKKCFQAYREVKGYDAARWALNKESEQQRNQAYRQTPEARKRHAERKAVLRPKHSARIRAWNAARKKHIARATPAWADLKAIEEIYVAANTMRAACGVEVHVDHVVPLRGRNVCGLHVADNLQLLSWNDNLTKACTHA